MTWNGMQGPWTAVILTTAASVTGCGVATDLLTSNREPHDAAVTNVGDTSIHDAPVGAVHDGASPADGGTASAPRLTVGDYAACLVRADGTLWCWGDDSSLGAMHPVATRFGTDTDWATVSFVPGWQNDAGAQRHGGWMCGIKRSGNLTCWGKAGGTAADLAGLVRQTASRSWSSLAIVSGNSGVAAPLGDLAVLLQSDGSLWGLGASPLDQFGPDAPGSSAVLLHIGSDAGHWSRVSASEFGTCGIRPDGSLWCLGNSYIVPNATDTCATNAAGLALSCSKTFQRVDASSDWTDMALGPSFAMALKRDGTLWCWGVTGNGQCGHQYVWSSKSPQLLDQNAWQQISPSGSDVCGIRRDGTLWCWGENQEGLLGNGGPSTSIRDPVTHPVQVGAGRPWSQVRVSSSVKCALESAGDVWCWGRGEGGLLGNGQLVDGQFPSAPLPVRVVGF
jgi:alpha-tubulin suppressor-like RCC1 family protein